MTVKIQIKNYSKFPCERITTFIYKDNKTTPNLSIKNAHLLQEILERALSLSDYEASILPKLVKEIRGDK